MTADMLTNFIRWKRVVLLFEEFFPKMLSAVVNI